jgi:hypothetical protein
VEQSACYEQHFLHLVEVGYKLWADQCPGMAGPCRFDLLSVPHGTIEIWEYFKEARYPRLSGCDSSMRPPEAGRPDRQMVDRPDSRLTQMFHVEHFQRLSDLNTAIGRNAPFHWSVGSASLREIWNGAERLFHVEQSKAECQILGVSRRAKVERAECLDPSLCS